MEILVGVVIFGGAFCLVVFLAVFSAQKLAAGVGGLLESRGKAWATTGRVATFIFSFISFLFAILLVFAVFFGR